ncbi:MAG: hypothetical protein NC048_10375, partial [Bacteroides sp.]|nr:hypothetical protein [Bacteroides sp.]
KVADWINKGLATYIDKQKALDYISVPAPIAGAQYSQGLSDATKVVQDFENPKIDEEVRFRRNLTGTAEDKRLGVISLTPDGATRRQKFHNAATAAGRILLDDSLPVKNLINHLRRAGGRVTSGTDLWERRTTVSSRAMERINRYKRDIGEPLSEVLRKIYRATKKQQGLLPAPSDFKKAAKRKPTYMISMYLMAKHMPERSRWMLADSLLKDTIEKLADRILYTTGGRGKLTDGEKMLLRREAMQTVGDNPEAALTQEAIRQLAVRIHALMEERNKSNVEKAVAEAEAKGLTIPSDKMQHLTVEELQKLGDKAFANLTERQGKLTDKDRDFAGETAFVERFGMTPEQYVERFEGMIKSEGLEADLERMWSLINQSTQGTLQSRMEDGLLSKEAYDAIMARGWKNYVPLRSWDERNTESEAYFEVDYPERIDVNAKVFTDNTKHAEGRSTLADNPIAYLFRDAETAIRKGEENRYFQAVAKLRDDNANFTYIFGNAAFLKGRETSSEKQSRLVPYYKNGEKLNVVFVNLNLAAAVRGDTESSMGKVWRALVMRTIQRFTRFMSAMLTSMNPAFAVMNLMRDLGLGTLSRFVEAPDVFRGSRDAVLFLYEFFVHGVPAAIQASVNPGSVYKGQGSNARLIRAFRENGGETGWHMLNDLRDTKKRLYKDITRRDFGRVARGAYTAIPSAFRFFTEISENSVRLAAFSDAKRRGLDDQAAAYYAKEITTNFNRRSKLSSAVNPAFMFFNAATQGVNRILQLMKENPGNFAVAATGMFVTGFVSAVLNAVGGDDDDDYLHRSMYVRANNLVIGKWTIPLAHGFRLFNGLGAAYADYVMGNSTKTELFYNFLSIVGNEILPGLLNVTDAIEYDAVQDRNTLSLLGYTRTLAPSPLLPAYESLVNRDYMGATINRKPLDVMQQKYSPRVARSKANANPYLLTLSYRWAGLWGFDPELDSEIAWDDDRKRPRDYPALSASDMEHLISGYAGGTGEFVNDMVKIGRKMYKGEEVSKEDIPVVKKLFRPTDEESAILRDYYDIKEYADVLQAKIDSSWKQLEKYNLSDKACAKLVDRLKTMSIDQARELLPVFNTYQKHVDALSRKQREGAPESEIKFIRLQLMREANQVRTALLYNLNPKQGKRFERTLNTRSKDIRRWAKFWDILEATYAGEAVNE